jgi:hypothetical protein
LHSQVLFGAGAPAVQKEMTDVIGDIERLIAIHHQVLRLRRLAADDTFDREISQLLNAPADEIERRTRDADQRRCSPISVNPFKKS